MRMANSSIASEQAGCGNAIAVPNRRDRPACAALSPMDGDAKMNGV
jgi:hypothetical protein